jgi:hypothetical protein
MEIFTLIISLIAIVLSLITLYRCHERSRRTEAINLLLFWSTSLNHKSSLARKYVEKLSKEQIKSLCEQEEVIFEEKDKGLCNQIKELLNIGDNHDNCKLTRSESAELRFLNISYLNTLESILTAWRHMVVDTEIIEEQFSYLINFKKGYEILKDFRQEEGGRDTYPSIEKFCEHLESKGKPKIKRKRRL